MAYCLVVDDTFDLREGIVDLLRSLGHRVDEANGVKEAKKLLSINSYDLVITDHGMPDGNGFEVLRTAAALPIQPYCIMMSGSNDPTLAERAKGFGAVVFLTKPFTVSDLIDVIDGLEKHAATG